MDEQLIDLLIKGLKAYTRNQIRWQTGMKKELRSLEDTLTKFKVVVFATASSDQNPDLNRWMWQLRDAIDEANDVLDGFKYTKLKEEQHQQQTRKVRIIKKSVKIVKRVLNIDPDLKKLEEVLWNLDQISNGINDYRPSLETTDRIKEREWEKRRETGSMTNDHQIDRDNYKKRVMDWLSESSNEEHQTPITDTTPNTNISLLSIVGLAGVGKTLLLQHVFKDEMTKKFYPKMWISVSQIFNEKQVIAKMLQSLKMEKCKLDSLDVLQKSLTFEIQKCQRRDEESNNGESNKFLLVLDDIWHEKINWDSVFTTLAEGGLGGKILITTRIDSIALMISEAFKTKKETLRLRDLENDDCLKLLKSFAFLRAKVHKNYVSKLGSIAGDIVKRLSGSPMEARAIGNVLNHNVDENFWKNISNDNFSEMSSDLKQVMEKAQENILSNLRFNYIFLKKEIQNCFVFCGIFPKGHNFDKEDLVQMWIALDFIPQPSGTIRTVEDEGKKYLSVLANNFLFDESMIEDRECYKMHDLIYKLANYVSKDECFRVEDNEQLLIIPEYARHLSVKISNPNEFRRIWKFKKLHSLFLFYEEDNDDLVDLLKTIFQTSRSIRLLYIKALHLQVIPEEIECLRHLRYLKLYPTEVTQPPKALSRLYHLKFKNL